VKNVTFLKKLNLGEGYKLRRVLTGYSLSKRKILKNPKKNKKVGSPMIDPK
jgi:hypothetical protein